MWRRGHTTCCLGFQNDSDNNNNNNKLLSQSRRFISNSCEIIIIICTLYIVHNASLCIVCVCYSGVLFHTFHRVSRQFRRNKLINHKETAGNRPHIILLLLWCYAFYYVLLYIFIFITRRSLQVRIHKYAIILYYNNIYYAYSVPTRYIRTNAI